MLCHFAAMAAVAGMAVGAAVAAAEVADVAFVLDADTRVVLVARVAFDLKPVPFVLEMVR